MKKNLLFVFISCVLLLAGCSKHTEIEEIQGTGDLETRTSTVNELPVNQIVVRGGPVTSMERPYRIPYTITASHPVTSYIEATFTANMAIDSENILETVIARLYPGQTEAVVYVYNYDNYIYEGSAENVQLNISHDNTYRYTARGM